MIAGDEKAGFEKLMSTDCVISVSHSKDL